MSRNIELYSGDSVDLIFHVQDAAGRPFNLDGSDGVRFGMSASPVKTADKIWTGEDGIEISDKERGIVTVKLDAGDTGIVGNRCYELEVAFGGRKYTAATGMIVFLPSILQS